MAKHDSYIVLLALALVAVAACIPAPTSIAPATAIPSTPTESSPAPTSTATAVPTIETSAPVTPTTPPTTEPDTSTGAADQVVGAVVRFTTGSASVDVTIGEDNPAVRDFLSMLPLTLTLEEFAGREKIAYLPRELEHAGSPGSDPEDGDLIYYIPWGNLGFYYNTAGIGYSDQTIHLGSYTASREQLEQLEGQPVTVEIVR